MSSTRTSVANGSPIGISASSSRTAQKITPRTISVMISAISAPMICMAFSSHHPPRPVASSRRVDHLDLVVGLDTERSHQGRTEIGDAAGVLVRTPVGRPGQHLAAAGANSSLVFLGREHLLAGDAVVP